MISTIEALAVLISTEAFFGDSRGSKRTRIQGLPTWTDNRRKDQLSTNSCRLDARPVLSSWSWLAVSNVCQSRRLWSGHHARPPKRQTHWRAVTPSRSIQTSGSSSTQHSSTGTSSRTLCLWKDKLSKPHWVPNMRVLIPIEHDRRNVVSQTTSSL